MRTRLPRCIGLFVALLWAGALPAAADTIVLDSDDVTDWARVFSSGTWKQKDACLHPNSLIKFDLSQVTDPVNVISARLQFFVESVDPGVAVELWHVDDDSWSYASTEPAELWDWPVTDLISTRVLEDTTSFSVDVTHHHVEEGMVGSTEFSVKLVASGPWYPRIRIASPTAPLERMRPRIVVEFLGPPAPPPIPDLAISPADIRLTPMCPFPGQATTLQATVRNIGAGGAWNIPVAFYEGEPHAGEPPIGIWIVPYLAPGGGSELASVAWTADRGLAEIHVMADFEGVLFETDETNNSALRTFLVVDPPEYNVRTESFEHPGRFAWHSDFDVPKQFEYPGPKSFYVNHSNGEAYHGEHSMEMYLDGTADDGTIWIETAVPVEPNSLFDVQVSFELFRYQPDMAFQPVAAVTLFDPEMERDFQVLEEPAQEGWTLHSYRTTISSGPYDMAHIAVGLTCTWETPGTFFIDLVRTVVQQIPPSAVPGGGAEGGDSVQLLQSRPNPSGSLATIAYRLAEPGPVSLQVFDTAGRLLTSLKDGRQEAGLHRVTWDATDAAGRTVPSGVYVYRLRTASGEQSRKMLIAR
jgi:hypothetical protein